MRRSLSEVPKGLRPIRTTSGRPGTTALEDDEQQAKGFVARLKWARQQALRQTGKDHATQPTPARVCLLALLARLLCSLTCLLACLLASLVLSALWLSLSVDYALSNLVCIAAVWRQHWKLS